MPGIIQILPEILSNQIAAGEVVLRPSSVLKELLENALDAKAKKIEVIILDGGKNLVQVVDDGIGMSHDDLRLCFERYATSKIYKIEDLTAITTKGFRGEALSAISIVAKIEAQSQCQEATIGSCLEINSGKIIFHKAFSRQKGTSISVKNLFLNIPARRKFLKEDTVEFKHILDEFLKVVLIHPEVSFKLVHQQKIIYALYPVNFKTRILQVFGNTLEKKILPLQAQNQLFTVEGFVSHPNYSKKNRNEQYLFVNKRYFKHIYFNNAIMAAYEGFLPPKQFPSYFLNFEVDPSTIDVNVHPQKTEILFESEKEIYIFLKSIIRKAISTFDIKIDFEDNLTTNIQQFAPNPIAPPKINIDKVYNPFFEKKTDSTDILEFTLPDTADILKTTPTSNNNPLLFETVPYTFRQWQQKFLLGIGEDMLIIHLPRVQRQWIYQQLVITTKADLTCFLGLGTHLLFPIDLFLDTLENNHFQTYIPLLKLLGFDFLIQAEKTSLIKMPSLLKELEVREFLIDLAQNTQENIGQDILEICRQKIAQKFPFKNNEILDSQILNHWGHFALSQNISYGFDGKKIIHKTYELNDIQHFFN